MNGDGRRHMRAVSRGVPPRRDQVEKGALEISQKLAKNAQDLRGMGVTLVSRGRAKARRRSRSVISSGAASHKIRQNVAEIRRFPRAR